MSIRSKFGGALRAGQMVEIKPAITVIRIPFRRRFKRTARALLRWLWCKSCPL